jgi:hypothetical protein
MKREKAEIVMSISSEEKELAVISRRIQDLSFELRDLKDQTDKK